MQDISSYIQIMIESLEKKVELLDTIIRKNNAQTQCVKGKTFDEVDWDAFNLLMAEKEAAINRINTMDEGFQNLYDRIRDEIQGQKDKYAVQIKRIQELIKKVTDQGVSIQTSEEKNKKMIESLVCSRKQMIRQSKTSLKAATSYYQSMRNAFPDDFSELDKKK